MIPSPERAATALSGSSTPPSDRWPVSLKPDFRITEPHAQRPHAGRAVALGGRDFRQPTGLDFGHADGGQRRVPHGLPIEAWDTGAVRRHGSQFSGDPRDRDRIAAEYGLTVHTLHPTLTMEEQTSKLGILY